MIKNKILNTSLSKVKMVTQKIGTSLSGMIMPIIGIIIAWGLLTAFFIPTGWTPVGVINDYVVGNVIKWVIPIMIGFLGGKQIYGMRGGFVAALSTAGIVSGAIMFEEGSLWSVKAALGAQFLGAMITGPLSAFVLKKLESLWEGKIKTGFEMLVNNFSMGIIGMGLTLFSFFITPWSVYGLTYALEQIVDPLTKYKALPVTSIFVEPAKPLFLNNAINHGVFTPLGNIDVTNHGKSILFYIESNPGPGLGILLAYILMNKEQRGSASSASVIHFFGGIHEVYFPFIIMRPILVIAAILGGATGVAVLQIFNAGAMSPASPGSVVALFLVSEHSSTSYIGLALSIASATGVSLLVSILLMKFTKKKQLSKNEAIAKMNAAKGKTSKYVKSEDVQYKNIKNVIFACDAGMGSSAMGAGILRKLFKSNNLDIKVTNCAIRDLGTKTTDLVVVQNTLSDRAKLENKTQQFIVKNFLEKDQYQKLLQLINSKENSVVNNNISKKDDTSSKLKSMINNKNIKFNGTHKNVKSAIDHAGNLLLENKYISKEYINSMHKRNEDISVYIGNGVAIPHGQSESSKWIKKSGISITTYPKGIKWGNEKAYIVIGIAGKGDNHMEILSDLAIKLSDEATVKKISNAKTLKELKGLL